jgi:hypothetical protein
LIPKINNLEETLKALQRICERYPKDSQERGAIHTASLAIRYVSHLDTKSQFEEWVNSLSLPLTALQVMHMKLCGIDDIPHELMDETLQEIEQLMERMRHIRK